MEKTFEENVTCEIVDNWSNFVEGKTYFLVQTNNKYYEVSIDIEDILMEDVQKIVDMITSNLFGLPSNFTVKEE